MATVKWEPMISRVRVDDDHDETMTYDRALRLLLSDGVIPDVTIDLALYVDGWAEPWTLYLDGWRNMRAICPTATRVRPIVER